MPPPSAAQLPRNLNESYGVSILLLSLSGLFPCRFDARRRQFRVSPRLCCLSLLHLTLYVLINVRLLLDDWTTYAEPLVGASHLTAGGNLLQRLLGAVITLLVLLPSLFASCRLCALLNRFLQLLERCRALQFDLERVYARIRVAGPLVALAVAGVVAFNTWHSVHFYAAIKQRPPSFAYFVAVVLSDYYKAMALLRLWMQLLTLSLLSQQLNAFLRGFRQRQVAAEQRRTAVVDVAAVAVGTKF